MNKKSLITATVIIVVLGTGWYLWGGGFSGWNVGTMFAPASPAGETAPATQTGAGGQTTGEQATAGQVGEQTSGQTATGSVGKMTDDIYVELIVQAAYQAQKNPSAYVSNMESLYKKYGITSENIQAYGEALGKDPARAQAVAQKYAQQLQQLMK